MADAPTILAFAGSLRAGSYNKMLARAAAGAAEAAGAKVTLIDLADYPMPIYDGDIEAESGIPEPAMRLKELMKAHDGLLMACPEYNSSITAALKNAIDWASRPGPGEGRLECFSGKTAALMSASPGALGGLRGLFHVQSILQSIGVLVIPDQLAIGKAHEAFDESGELIDDGRRQVVERIAHRLVETTAKLSTG